MGKGPDQGDFETPTSDATSASTWPTEPAAEPGDETTQMVPSPDASSTAAPEPAATTSTSDETTVDYLPTTSGPEAAAASLMAVAAIAIIGTGIALAWRRRESR